MTHATRRPRSRPPEHGGSAVVRPRGADGRESDDRFARRGAHKTSELAPHAHASTVTLNIASSNPLTTRLAPALFP